MTPARVASRISLSPRVLARAERRCAAAARRPLAVGCRSASLRSGSAASCSSTRVLGYFQTDRRLRPAADAAAARAALRQLLRASSCSRNTVTALTTFYLAPTRSHSLLAAPLAAPRGSTTRASSRRSRRRRWMVLLFGLPAFARLRRRRTTPGPVFYAGDRRRAGAVPRHPGRDRRPRRDGARARASRRGGARDALLVGVGLWSPAGRTSSSGCSAPSSSRSPSGLAGFAGFLAGFGATGRRTCPPRGPPRRLIPLLGARPGEPLF